MKADKSQPVEQRRKDDRYQLRAHATAVSDNESWSAHILNISLKGALIAVTGLHNLRVGSKLELRVELNKGVNLLLDGTVVHLKAHYVGLKCDTRTEEDAQLLNGLIARFQDGEPISAEY